MIFTIQQLIKVVPNNMYLVFTLNHTSKDTYRPEIPQSLLCWFYQAWFLEILPFFFFLMDLHHPFSYLLPGYHAQQQRRRKMRNCSPWAEECRMLLQQRRIHPTALGSPLPAYSYKFNKIKAAWGWCHVAVNQTTHTQVKDFRESKRYFFSYKGSS